jgi:cobalt-zinc-cadmium efflux system membrane fusion protein
VKPSRVVAWVLVSCIVGCTKPSPSSTSGEAAEHAGGTTSGTPHADEPAHEELPKRVHLTPEVIASAKIKSAPASREVLEAVLELPGEIAADPDKMARVATPISGRIERVAFTEGKPVKARDLLAVIRVPDLADRQAAFASLSAKATAARTNARRLEALAARGLAAAQELTEAKATADALEAEARAAAERLHVLGLGASGKAGSLLELRAPIDGTVVSRDAVVGQPVSPEHPIATIVDLGEVWFLGRVFENDLARVRVSAAAEVQLNAYPRERFEGHIEFLGRQIDPVARTVVARVRLANRQELLRLGLFGTARISAGEGQKGAPSLVVLRAAITEINGKSVVFVHHPDNDFELHEIVLGRSALGKVEVLSGLREGEVVVVEGTFTLKSLVLKSTIGEGD